MNSSACRRPTLLVFGSPLIGDAEIDEVLATLRSGWIGTGPRVAEFEEMMAKYTGARHAIALSSCTAALHLSLLAIGVGNGDEVITTPLTFAATANAILHSGATPVFADVDRATMLLDPKEIEKAISPRTKAILPVHFAGRVCAMDEIHTIAKTNGLNVIQDAAHCIEGRYHGRPVGAIGDLTCFSFYVTKNLTTAEGGMVVTDNDEWAEQIRLLSFHGIDLDAFRRFRMDAPGSYEIVAAGYKYNMTDVQAAMGIHQLGRIEPSLQRRNKIWEYYSSMLSILPISLPAPDDPDTRHARHLYTPLIYKADCGLSRDEVVIGMRERNIGTGLHYRPIHLHKYYRERFSLVAGAYPNAELIGEGTVSLPLSAALTDDDVDDVVAALRAVLLS